jgi:hypothetical protein
MHCSKCGCESDDSGQFCTRCGSQLIAAIGVSTPLHAEQESRAGVEDAYKVVIGPKHQATYLAYFVKADSQGKPPISWHWPAFFVTLYWLLYRKMWLPAFIYFLLPYLFLVPLSFIATAFGNSAETFVTVATLGYFALTFLLPPLYANAMYYRHCKKQIRLVQESSNNEQRQLGELTGRGGTSKVMLAIVAILGIFTFIGIAAAIALPAFQDYKTRAAMADVHRVARSAGDAVAQYYAHNQRMPNSLEEADFVPPSTAAIRAVTINKQNGVVSVTVALSPIDGKSLLLVPTTGSANALTWTCRSDDIPKRLLPPACRQ